MQKNGAQSSSHADRHASVPNPAITTGNEPHEATLGVDLTATIINVSRGEPRVLAIQEIDSGAPRRWKLPVVPYPADGADGLDDMLRDGIQSLTGLQLGYVEQLESELVAIPNGYDGASPSKRINVNYVALASDKTNGSSLRGGAAWIPLYDLLPWEDWRSGKPFIIANVIAPKLEEWSATSDASAESRRDDARVCFGTCQGGWDEEKVGERLGLLMSSNTLLPVLKEYASARRAPRKSDHDAAAIDDRNLLQMARALGRLRAQIKVKPIVFELVPDRFTLYELQQTVEAILGPPLHKQNFRRLVEHMGLVEPTGEIKSHTGGRPAQLFRFRPSVVLEHVHPGMRVRGARL